jgi:hypothetical protein
MLKLAIAAVIASALLLHVGGCSSAESPEATGTLSEKDIVFTPDGGFDGGTQCTVYGMTATINGVTVSLCQEHTAQCNGRCGSSENVSGGYSNGTYSGYCTQTLTCNGVVVYSYPPATSSTTSSTTAGQSSGP